MSGGRESTEAPRTRDGGDDPGEVRAPIARLIPSSVVDGPGNRVAVFTQGCPFDCVYCHNPETIARFDPGNPPPGATLRSAAEVAAFALTQRPFASGVTASGGECLLHERFLELLFGLVRKEGMTTLVDSNGFRAFSGLPRLVEVLDGVLLDVKAWDPEEHRRVAGASNDATLANLQWLAAKGLLVEARTALSPGLFDEELTVREVSRVLARALPTRFGPPVYRLTAFRPLGVREAFRDLPVPDARYLDGLARLAKENGAPSVVIVG